MGASSFEPGALGPKPSSSSCDTIVIYMRTWLYLPDSYHDTPYYQSHVSGKLSILYIQHSVPSCYNPNKRGAVVNWAWSSGRRAAGPTLQSEPVCNQGSQPSLTSASQDLLTKLPWFPLPEASLRSLLYELTPTFPRKLTCGV